MVNPLSNAAYLLPPLITVVASLALIGLVWRGTRMSFNSCLFCGFLLSLGLWGLLLFGMRSSPDVHRAVVWDRALPAAFYLTFVLYYHFTLAYTNARGQRRILLASYLFLAVILALTPTDLMVERMRLEHYGYAPVVGPALVPVSIAGVLLMGGGAYNLVRRYKASTSYEERNRLLYLIIAILFPLTGSFLDALSNLPPVGIWSTLVFCVLCSVAILKYHLLDIRVVVRKSLVYLVASAVIAIPYAGILIILTHTLRTAIEPWWAHAFVILLLAILLRPLYSRAQHLVDRLFYRDRYDYLRALQRFSLETRSIAGTEELGATLVNLVRGALRSSNACLLLPSRGSSGLAVASCVGLDDPPSGVVLRSQGLLAKWLKLHGSILSYREFNIIPELQSLGHTEKQKLEELRAELYVPIKTREGELSGVLVLGEKLSQQDYSDADRGVLSSLAGQMATTLENARLYSDALRARENLETWLNSMTDGVKIVNADYTIQFMNEAAVEAFGSRVGDKCWTALGKHTACPGDCAARHFLYGITKTLRMDQSKRVGFHYSQSVGDRQYDVAAAPLLNPDGSLSIIVVLRDVSERKQAEQRERLLQQELDLSARLASIGRLVSGVAHEINNPLTGIMGFSQRLLKKSTDEEVRIPLERIHNEAQRAAKVVQNLLTFARNHKPKKENLDVNDIVKKTLELRAYELRTNNIEVVTDLATNLPKIMADFYRIQEVFLNIILNAEQAMTEAKSRGRLSIKTEEMKGCVRISFTDDGRGISAEDLDRIFDPFFTTREERGGTGLGLSVCHGVVVEHGGRIYAERKLGKGITFLVELPMRSEELDKNKVADEEPGRRSR